MGIGWGRGVVWRVWKDETFRLGRYRWITLLDGLDDGRVQDVGGVVWVSTVQCCMHAFGSALGYRIGATFTPLKEFRAVLRFVLFGLAFCWFV